MDLRRALPTIGLVTLLVLDLVLVIWALWPSGRNAPAAATSVSPQASASVTPSPSPSASASPSPSATPAAGPTPVRRVLVAVDDRTAWLATTGSCAKPGTLQVTTDAGATWAASAAPGAVTRLRPSGRSEAFAVGGTSDDCAMRLWTTSNAGEDWGDPASASAAWARDAGDSRRVIRPGENPVTPCGKAAVLDLASLGRATASVLCGDGRVRTTTDGGDQWPTAFTAKGALAFSLLPNGRGAVASLADGCEGTSVITLVEGSPDGTTCVEGAAAAPGAVAISVTADAAWLVAGDAAFTASEVGGRWTQAKGDVRS
ncbi:MAG TPA: hypothetical protein VFI44_09580 [Ornithinibacter sp.]|nr:hypothetical protein [Ornithinibacter sp.]